ncbi:MAG: hypothetical protein ACRENX_00200 [Candidatus Dormibacteria bacterium]
MNLFRKRSTIVLASVGAVGAIAAIATAASLALFYDPVAPSNITYASGNVTLNGPYTFTCTTYNNGNKYYQTNVDNIYPDYSTTGYPQSLGDHTGTLCSEQVEYTGSLDAFLGLDVKVATSAGTSVLDCNGDNALGTAQCAQLYNPSPQNGAGQGLEVWVFGKPDSNPGNNDLTQDFGIGNDQTLQASGSTNVDTSYSDSPGPSCGAGPEHFNCPVTTGFVEDLSVYVYWPLDAADDQNVYQNASATITLDLHAVQAADNPLYDCPPMSDTANSGPIFAGIYQPNQPENGWGAGLYAGGPGKVNSCPATGPYPGYPATEWTSSTKGTSLIPFFHPDVTPPSP